MAEVLQTIGRVASSEARVLITGESGTGKELAARRIHATSKRAGQPFVGVCVTAIPRDLLESCLFGHVQGSFSGAFRNQEGLIPSANGGTLFLDEVADMPPATQIKLLRVLQERELYPVGSSRPVKVDIRLIAACNVSLEEQVDRGAFRKDLYYRLDVVPIEMPPLRHRRKDIPLLVTHLLEKFHAKEMGVIGIAKEALAYLMDYGWPGNVRELENVIERAIILHRDPLIQPEDLGERILRTSMKRPITKVIEFPKVDYSLEQLEKAYILHVLEKTGWKRKATAMILGINSSTLYRKLQQYGIQGSSAQEIHFEVPHKTSVNAADEDEGRGLSLHVR
jgi:DNA-binding NtrC family response regulator